MCGICGIVEFGAAGLTDDALEKACAALRHRGPDHCGTWLSADRRVALGATRLKVLDPSAKADQPLHRHERFHLVYNGEVYNFREIRAELAALGETFVSDGDTEVVLAACAQWGIEAFNRFNGMWALCFYDSQRRTGFLSRDRFGVKPLMYALDGGRLYFASELRALTQLGNWDRQLHEPALIQHLMFGYIAHPATIYESARRLPPGHYLEFDAKGAREPVRFYAVPDFKSQISNLKSEISDFKSPSPDYNEARDSLHRMLADAVVARRVSDVPIGAFLSGGLDSSIIVHELSETIGRPVETFSVGYADGPALGRGVRRAYDETGYARLAAEAFGTRHHELVLTQSDVLQAIPKILDHLGEPVGDSSIVPTTLLSQFARQFVTVALSGDGGDELFGGYWRYLGHNTLATYQRIPRFLRRALVEPMLALLASSRSSRVGNRVRQFRKLLRQTASPLHKGGPRGVGLGDATGAALSRHVAWSRILAPEAEPALRNVALARECELAALLVAQQTAANPHPLPLSLGGRGVNGGDPLSAIFAFDLQYQLPADMLQKVDLASMMHSLEVRVPFLDYRVVEAALAMPASWKIERGLGKRILVDAYRGRIPDAILDRSKQGFEVPIGELLRGPLRETFHDVVDRSTVESLGLLSYSAIQSIYAAHATRRTDHADLLWALLSLCWWRRR